MLKSIARAGMMPEGGFNNPFLGATALRVAASRGHVHVIRYLLSQHSKLDVNAVDAKLTSAIYYAAKNGNDSFSRAPCVSYVCVVCVVRLRSVTASGVQVMWLPFGSWRAREPMWTQASSRATRAVAGTTPPFFPPL